MDNTKARSVPPEDRKKDQKFRVVGEAKKLLTSPWEMTEARWNPCSAIESGNIPRIGRRRE